jgi:hypothetical protein
VSDAERACVHVCMLARARLHAQARRTVLKTALGMDGVPCAQPGDVLYEWDQVQRESVCVRERAREDPVQSPGRAARGAGCRVQGARRLGAGAGHRDVLYECEEVLVPRANHALHVA